MRAKVGAVAAPWVGSKRPNSTQSHIAQGYPTEKRVSRLVALGTFFVVFQGFEWASMLAQGLTLTSSTMGSFFYLIVGMHGLHAIVAIGFMLRIWLRFERGWLQPSQLASAAVFWYFVVAAWPVIYWQVYL